MDIESQYLAALDLTHQMLSATKNQEWDALAALEKRRAEAIAAIAPISPQMSVRNPAMAGRIAGIIREIEQESNGIVEQVHVWQEHTKILLRMKTPPS